MILFVTGVGTLIHLYSIGYMHGDPRFSPVLRVPEPVRGVDARARARLELPADLHGLGGRRASARTCSISFWFERNSAAVAGKKAFVTNRVGDFGFMLAMFLIFQKVGHARLRASRAAPRRTCRRRTVTAIALLLFVGAMGKSAQVPLHIWLPDAMEGPTPVSALIHAATMVTAGVFLIVRAHAFFDVSDHAGTVVAWVGAITALVRGDGRARCRTTSSGCSRTPRSASSATCSSRSASARTAPRSST